MPSIDQLQIVNFRNLSEISLSPSRSVNLIYGRNGSGKTSLLEALYVLSSGKSFRSALVDPLIKLARRRPRFTPVLGTTLSSGCPSSKTHQGSAQARNGENQKNWDQVARSAPCRCWSSIRVPLSCWKDRLGSAAKFLDWLAFHVEPWLLRLLAPDRKMPSKQKQSSQIRLFPRVTSLRCGTRS